MYPRPPAYAVSEAILDPLLELAPLHPCPPSTGHLSARLPDPDGAIRHACDGRVSSLLMPRRVKVAGVAQAVAGEGEGGGDDLHVEGDQRPDQPQIDALGRQSRRQVVQPVNAEWALGTVADPVAGRLVVQLEARRRELVPVEHRPLHPLQPA